MGVGNIHASLPQSREERGRDLWQLVSLTASAKNTSWLFSREFPHPAAGWMLQVQRPSAACSAEQPQAPPQWTPQAMGHSSWTLNFRRNIGGNHMAPILLFPLLHVYRLALKMKTVNSDACVVLWASIMLFSLHGVYNWHSARCYTRKITQTLSFKNCQISKLETAVEK